MWYNGPFMYKLAVCLARVVVSDPEPTGVGFPAAQTPLYGDADSNIEFRVKRGTWDQNTESLTEHLPSVESSPAAKTCPNCGRH